MRGKVEDPLELGNGKRLEVAAVHRLCVVPAAYRQEQDVNLARLYTAWVSRSPAYLISATLALMVKVGSKSVKLEDG